MIDANVAAVSSRSRSRPDLYDSPMVQAERRVLIDDSTSSAGVGRIVLATLFATLGPLSFGFCLGYSSSALEDFQNSTDHGIRMNDSEGSLFSSIFAPGAAVGSVIGGWTVEALGRKGTIMSCTAPFVIGWILITAATNHALLFIGRFITGIGSGMVSLTVPVYIAEISTANLRGTLGSCNQLAVTIGILLAYLFGWCFHWKWLALVGAVPPALLALLMYFVPETPRWSLNHNRRIEALESLRWFRGPEADIDEECHKIEATLDNNEQITLKEFCHPAVAKPLIISVALMVFQQFSGINAVLFNCASIFKDAGYPDGKLVAIAVGGFQFVGTAVACVIIDKTGRRALLLLGEAVMAISLVGLGLYFELNDHHHKLPWLSLSSAILFIVAFSLSLGPIPWLVMSEIFPLRARGRASSIATFVNWSLVFVVTYTFKTMTEHINNQGTYWLYGGFCLAGFIFVLARMPETKGKTLEEIEQLFGERQVPYERID